MIRSGFSSMALSKASAPSLSVCTVQKWTRACRNSSRIMGLSSTSRTLTLLGMMRTYFLACDRGNFASILSALAARLALQDDFANGDVFIQGLAHVVNGQRGDTGSHQRLHLHSGLGASGAFKTKLYPTLPSPPRP